MKFRFQWTIIIFKVKILENNHVLAIKMFMRNLKKFLSKSSIEKND